MLDVVNERLIAKGEEPIAFEHDCREGICGSCGMMINGQAHGPRRARPPASSTCGSSATATRSSSSRGGRRRSPCSATSSSIARAFDRIVEAGGYITAPTGAAPDANLIPIPKEAADAAMDAAACIGCGACVAACPNCAATAVHRGQGRAPQPVAAGPSRALAAGRSPWSTRWRSYFGSCTNHGECQKACPKEIRIDFIAYMNRDYAKAQLKNRKLLAQQ